MKLLKVVLASLVLASFAMIQGSTAVAASGYTLYGDATPVHPGNASDTAIQLRSDADPAYGGIDFDEVNVTPPVTTLSTLEYLSTDYMFTVGSCVGGSPRFQIKVSTSTGIKNIFVYIGPPPNYTGCTVAWTNTGDLLTPTSFVDTSQVGGPFYDTWANALTNYGTWTVTGIQLVADGSWAVAGGIQTVLVDNVMINATTYTFEEVVASDKERCKKGGWQDFESSPGPFKNQGDCVSYFATGGKNKASD